MAGVVTGILGNLVVVVQGGTFRGFRPWKGGERVRSVHIDQSYNSKRRTTASAVVVGFVALSGGLVDLLWLGAIDMSFRSMNMSIVVCTDRPSKLIEALI